MMKVQGGSMKKSYRQEYDALREEFARVEAEIKKRSKETSDPAD